MTGTLGVGASEADTDSARAISPFGVAAWKTWKEALCWAMYGDAAGDGGGKEGLCTADYMPSLASLCFASLERWGRPVTA